MDGRKVLLSLMAACALLTALSARASVIELSGTASYAKSDLGDGYTTLQRRYSGSVEFKITPVSGIEFEYSDTYSKYSSQTNVGSFLAYYTTQNNIYRDKTYSINWVQNLVPSTWIIQPYISVGAGKVDRVIRQEIPEINQGSEVTQNQKTGTAGIGLRIFFLRNLALKLEMKTYLPEFKLSTWKANEMTSAGLSWNL